MRPSARRSCGPGKARAALLWGLLFFAGAQVALDAVMDRRWPEVRDPKFGPLFGRKYLALRSRLRERTDAPLVLMVGSSLTGLGFRGQHLEDLTAAHGRALRAFNFGLFGAGTITNSLYGQRLLAEGVRPQLLLIEVMPFSLDEPGPGHACEEEQSLYTPGVRAEDLARLWRYHSRPGRMCGDWLQAHSVPCYTRRAAILRRLGQSWLPPPPPDTALLWPMDRSGWICAPIPIPPAAVRSRSIRDGIAAHSLQFPATYRDYRIAAGVRRALQDLLEGCRRRQVRVAVVLMPEEPTYHGFFAPYMEERLQGLLADVRRRYDCPCIDARGWVPDKEFADPGHLSWRGAALFTDRLTGEVERLLAAP